MAHREYRERRVLLDPVYREFRVLLVLGRKEFKDSKEFKEFKVVKAPKELMEFKVLLVFRGKLDYKASKEP